jgi:MYXO-CTERM domain-containing protein
MITRALFVRSSSSSRGSSVESMPCVDERHAMFARAACHRQVRMGTLCQRVIDASGSIESGRGRASRAFPLSPSNRRSVEPVPPFGTSRATQPKMLTSRRAVFLVAAAAILSGVVMPRAALAQQCAVSQVGQLCAGGAGACVQSTCTSYDAGVSQDEPCAFCEPVACPVAQVGQPCEAGTCTQATCTTSDDAGNAVRQTCAVCTTSPADSCSQAQSGQACDGGGVCTSSAIRALGPAGLPPPAELYYPVWLCVVTPEAGPCCVDAGVTLGLSPGDGSAPSKSSVGSNSAGSGCDLSAGDANSSTPHLGLLFGGLVAAVARRRNRVFQLG